MVERKTKSLVQRRREQLQTLGPLAPRFSLILDTALGQHDLFMSMPLRRSKIAIAVTAVILLIFSLPLFTVGGPFLDQSDDSLFSLVFLLFSLFWLFGWTAFVVLIALVLVVLLFGRETVRVKDNKFYLRMGIPGLGFGAAYHADLIRNFRTAAADEGMGNSWRGEHLAFDYNNEPIHFGSAISAASATKILQPLIDLFPLQACPPPDLSALGLADTQPELAPERPLPVTVKHMKGKETGKETSKEASTGIRLGSISTLALIGANLIPLLGVLLDGWSIGEIMVLFWAESAVIGVYNLCKMWQVGRWSVLFYGPFFIGHYGGFMVVHLLFIYGFFGGESLDNIDVSTADVAADFLRLWPALLGFFISHGISWLVNFRGRGEFAGRSMGTQMNEPYKRIIIMHVTIIFGGFLVLAFGSILPALILLVLLKTMSDLRAHLREHSTH